MDFSFGPPNGALELALLLMTGAALGLIPAALVIPLVVALLGFPSVGRLSLVVKKRTVLGSFRHNR